MKRARRRIPIYVPGQEFQVERFTPMHQSLVHEPSYFPHTALSKHHPPGGGGGGGGGGLTFEGQSYVARPYAKVGMNPVPFTTLAGLNTAITNMVGGDYIFYNGTTPQIFNSSGSNILNIQNKNPSSPVVIDFGTRQSVWNPGLETGGYVGFNYTGGTSTSDACYINNCSNIAFYGGDVSAASAYGVIFQGNNHNLGWYDAYVHDVGIQGFHLRGTTGSGGAAEVHDVTIRAEVNHFALNPSGDPHPDKGTGIHAFLFHDTNGGNIHDCNIGIYAHDALQPNELSGYTEGGGGSAIEIGSPSTANANNTFYVKALRMNMIPNGTNPGSTASQTGGNAINLWGNVDFNGMVFGWLQGEDLTGQLLSAAGGSYWPGVPAVKVLHGRWHNINQSTAGSNVPEPYPTQTKTGATLGFVYQDMLAY